MPVLSQYLIRLVTLTKIFSPLTVFRPLSSIIDLLMSNDPPLDLARLNATLRSVLWCRETTPAGREVAGGEVLNISINNNPRDARQALRHLLLLHENGDFESYHTVLGGVWNDRRLMRRYGDDRNALPLLSLVIDSTTTLASVEELILSDNEDATPTPLEPIDLVLAVTVKHDAEEIIPSIISIVRRLKKQDSMFNITIVELSFTVDLANKVLTRHASCVCRLLLLEIPTTKTLDVSLTLLVPGFGECSLTTCGEFFQTVCRVGAKSIPDRVSPEQLVEYPYRLGNSLRTTIKLSQDDRIVGAFWSAIAYSRGYTHLIYDRDETNKASRSSIFLAMIALGYSDICVLYWGQSDVPKTELEKMAALRDAPCDRRTQKLIKALRKANQSTTKISLDLSKLNKAIIADYGLVLQDTRDGDCVDKFIPGYANCRVRRSNWFGVVHTRTNCDQDHQPQSLLQLHFGMGAVLTSSNLRLFTAFGESLTKIDINASTTPSGMLTILRSCPDLRQLKFGHLEAPTSPLFALLGPRLGKLVATKLTHLAVVCFHGNKKNWFDAFFSRLVARIASQLAHVEISLISDNPISTDLSCRALVDLCPKLRHLHFDGVKLNSLDAISTSLFSASSPLAELILTGCYLRRDRLIEFASNLADQRCSQAFTALCIGEDQQFDERNDGFDVKTFEAFLAMATINRCIRKLQLSASRPLRWIDRANQLRLEVQAFQAEDMQADTKWLRTRYAVALLGILRHRPLLPLSEETVCLIVCFACKTERTILAKINITHHTVYL